MKLTSSENKNSPAEDKQIGLGSSNCSEFVSVVIPCYNEERYILKALRQLADQYDKSRYELVVVDGGSVDKTRDVVEEFRLEQPDVAIRLIDNPARNIPTALNLGIAAARGNIIARMDAHAVPSTGYIRRCVEVLRDVEAAVVGMPCHIRPGSSGLIAQSIASAVSNPFGIGDATYRLPKGTSPQESVDTVAFACFRKSLWEELGGFNEALLTNEDYDFNYRVRLSGRQVILDRGGYCDYFARTTIGDLARQYARYGRWKARMVRLHPRSTKVRHLAAPIFVLSLVGLAVLALAWPIFSLLLLAEVTLYFALALAFSRDLIAENSGGIRMWLLMPVLFSIIHLVWGINFLIGLVSEPK